MTRTIYRSKIKGIPKTVHAATIRLYEPTKINVKIKITELTNISVVLP
jgi:hypothetical protein